MTLPNWAKCASICSSSSPAVQGQHCQLLQQQRHTLVGGAQNVRGARSGACSVAAIAACSCGCHSMALCTGKPAYQVACGCKCTGLTWAMKVEAVFARHSTRQSLRADVIRNTSTNGHVCQQEASQHAPGCLGKLKPAELAGQTCWGPPAHTHTHPGWQRVVGVLQAAGSDMQAGRLVDRQRQ